MRKKTLSIILNIFIVLLVLMICMLLVMIAKRGAKPLEPQNEQLAATEPQQQVQPEETAAVETEPVEEEITEEAAEPTRVLYATPNVESSANVRSGGGTGYDRIGAAYVGEKFAVLEVMDNGWTKLEYNGGEGYVSTDLLKFFYEVTDAEGNVTKEDVEMQ